MPEHSQIVHVALPVQDEVDYLPSCVDALRAQEGIRLVVWFCVNQPDDWHTDPQRRPVCAANRISLDYVNGLKAEAGLEVRVLDRTSPGAGWSAKKRGVGQARKTIMDAISAEAAPEDLIVSLDADTRTPSGYLQGVAASFRRHPEASGLSARYRHPVTDDAAVSRAMLGYEIYMRLYVLNLWRIGSPYAFTALGSAIALPVRVYKKIGGLTPRASSEDFYLLQKLVKHGRLLQWTEVAVEPATRKSYRVPVGTGQAIVAACEGTYADRYPLYPAVLFDLVQQTTGAFDDLFDGPVTTPLDVFMREWTGEQDPWQRLRENHPTRERFVRGCHERLDGLRILQFVKAEYRKAPTDDRSALMEWLDLHGRSIEGFEPAALSFRGILEDRPFQEWSIAELDALRGMLSDMEDRYRRQADLA